MEKNSITHPESHPGRGGKPGKEHVHWGPKDNPRGKPGGAINKDGSIRHGSEPSRKVKKKINRRTGWGLRGMAPLFLFPGQMNWMEDKLKQFDPPPEGDMPSEGDPCH